MAISEKTKQLTLRERNRLQATHNKNAVDADALEAQAVTLREANKEIAKDIAALKKTFPTPSLL